MSSMCHVCARCFDSTEVLQKHIEDERRQLIRDVQELCTKPYLPVSSALGILLRYATHSSDLDVGNDSGKPMSDSSHPAPRAIPIQSARHWTCPESCCDYASTSTYQDLQRHYRTHVECKEACPFCLKPLDRVSQFVRHPDECAARKRKGLEISDTVAKRQKTLSEYAYNGLRLARQHPELSRRAERDRSSGRLHSTPVTDISSVDTTATTATLGNDSLSGLVSSELPLPPAGSSAFDTGLSYNNRPPSAPLTSAPADDAGDNATRHAPNIDPVTAESIPPFLVELSTVRATGQRAPTLSYSLVDGGITYPQDDGTMRRAPTLYNSLIDGALIHSFGQDLTDSFSICPPGSFTVASITQRAPALIDSLIDGAMDYSILDQYTTVHGGISTSDPNLVFSDAVPSSSHEQSHLGGDDIGMTSTGIPATADHLYHRTLMAEGTVPHCTNATLSSTLRTYCREGTSVNVGGVG